MSDIHGLLNIYKPPGLTSFQVVARVRRWTGVRRVGHAGTLDMGARGVLPVALGPANRLMEYFHGAPKVYKAQIELGQATDTYDGSGQVVSRSDPTPVTLPQLQEALARFQGSIWQVPPPFSALHHRGRRLHELARAGIPVTLAPRQVDIFRLELVSWDSPFLGIEVECGRGTYIRSLAHDLGQALGCGAYLKELERTRYGPFLGAEAISLEELEAACAQGWWPELIYPEDEPLLSWPAVILSQDQEKAFRYGQEIVWPKALPKGPMAHRGLSVGPTGGQPNGASERHPEPSSRALRTKYRSPFAESAHGQGGQAEGPVVGRHPEPAEGRCRVYSLEGQFLGVLRYLEGDGRWRPEKVFSLTPSLGE